MLQTSPKDIRQACRKQEFDAPTCGYCPGHAQANLVILPREYAFDFLLFCQRNPKSCPLLEVLEPGCFTCDAVAQDCDVRCDLPRYRLFENGVFVNEVNDISSLWNDNLVTFLIGCSFSFEEALISNNVPMRHIDEKKNVPMYNTNIACRSAGCFGGNLVVSMRPLQPADAIRATTVTARYPRVHGAPVHFGDPSAIGIADLLRPDYGDAVAVHTCSTTDSPSGTATAAAGGGGEVPVFWACGVTPQAVVMASRPSFCVTHAPGYMLMLDIKNEDLAIN